MIHLVQKVIFYYWSLKYKNYEKKTFTEEDTLAQFKVLNDEINLQKCHTRAILTFELYYTELF